MPFVVLQPTVNPSENGEGMTGLLFIDDEERVRRSVTRALRPQSYKIYTAENGDNGIKVVQEHRSEITMVISDFKFLTRIISTKNRVDQRLVWHESCTSQE
jgi:response regulator RpfG family c-di-GMP phosphodiesterase